MTRRQHRCARLRDYAYCLRFLTEYHTSQPRTQSATSIVNPTNRVIQGLWIGSQLSALEQLSIQSFLANGHEFHLYTYDEVENAPSNVILKNAEDVLPSTYVFKYRDHDSYSGFSNFFRYRLLEALGGWWVDLDLICLKPFDFADDYVFSSEISEGNVHANVGAIKCPAGSELMQYLWNECSRKHPEDLKWGEVGPRLFAEGVRRFEMGRYVTRPKAFCPIGYAHWKDSLDPNVDLRFTCQTYAVHLWNELWRREGFNKDDSYDEGCLFERLKARYLPQRTAVAVRAPTITPEVTALPVSTVSAVVLSKNGAKRIARCLESIISTGFTDEIVVCVDAATTDNTYEIARTFTPHVHVITTDGYIESALPKITSLCSCDYVLRVDDDECLAGNWDKASFQLLAIPNDLAEVWVPTRWLAPPGDRFIANAPWFPDEHLRLFLNDPGRITWPKRVHEQMRVLGNPLHLHDRWIDHYNLVDCPKGERRRRDHKYRELGGASEPEYYLFEDHETVLLPCSTTPLEVTGTIQQARSKVKTYQAGSTIFFTCEGTCKSYLGEGWSSPEPWGTWTDGDSARLVLPLAARADGRAVLTAEVVPYLSAKFPTLAVDVLYRESVIAQWTFCTAGAVTVMAEIDQELLAGQSRLVIHFRIRNPRSPLESGESADPRALGLSFRSLSLSFDEASPGRAVSPQRISRESLASKATRIGKSVLPGGVVDVIWEGMWVAQVNGTYFPLPQATSPENIPWESLAGAAAQYIRDTEDYWYFSYQPRPGDVIVDIGAGRGEDVYSFSRSVGESGRVFAIEPHPVSFSVLEKFCKLNRLSNVTLVNSACVATPRELHIETVSNWQSNFVTESASETSFPVDAVTFDSIWKEHSVGPIGFLKMNIEGAEREALPGAREALAHTAHVCIAAHDFKADRGHPEWNRTKAFVTEFVRDCGFRIVTRENDRREWARDHIHGTRF